MRILRPLKSSSSSLRIALFMSSLVENSTTLEKRKEDKLNQETKKRMKNYNKKLPLAITNVSVGNITSLPHEVLQILEEESKKKMH